MTPKAERMAIQELANVAESCVPCDSGSGACRLHAAVNKALPALHSLLRRIDWDEKFHPSKAPGHATG